MLRIGPEYGEAWVEVHERTNEDESLYQNERQRTYMVYTKMEP